MDGLEVLAISAAMHTHLNILQEDMVWTSYRNDFSEQDVTIVMCKEGAMLCEWPQPIPFSDKSVHNDPPASMRSVVSTLGGWPRVRDLV